MVKSGGITVELVAADTKEPFKEHTAPDGQIYAEVEPDMDYFISVRSAVGGLMVTFAVDGVDLGYHTNFPGSGYVNVSSYNGTWERKDGKQSMTALHFNKTRQAQGVTPDMLTGKVEVKVYALGDKYYENMSDYVSASLDADSTLGGKKCIKSTTSGSHSFDQTPKGQTASSTVVNYKFGEYLRTITLNYCSALGLIYHKILPRPPDLESDDDSVPVKKERSMKRKRSTATSVSTARRVSPRRVSPAGKTMTIQDNNEEPVEMVTVQKTYALVDLTGDD